jgi:8-hydroxy-5-deazaflavin:NADPH oxidoreductase
MRIGVLGTGMVGETLSTKFVELGHDVVMGARSAGNDKAVAWSERFPERAGQGSFADAAAHGEMVVNATAGVASVEALRAAGADNLAGKTLLDVANPLDFSGGFPPRLSVVNDDSLGEQIQREFPAARVVKALNTMNCLVMVDPARLAGDHDVLMAGDDEAAKRQVTGLLESFGWPAPAIRDLGGIRSARGLESYLPLWLSLMGILGTGDFNIHVAH